MDNEETRNITESINAVANDIKSIGNNFTNFCIAITNRVSVIETIQESHKREHETEKQWMREDAERIREERRRELAILGLILTAVSIITGILIKIL